MLQRAIDVYHDTMPRNTIAYEDVVPSAVPLRPMVARTCLAVLSSRVILCGLTAEKDSSHFQRQLSAARWMSDIYRELNTVEGHLYSYVCIAVSSFLSSEPALLTHHSSLFTYLNNF